MTQQENRIQNQLLREKTKTPT